MELQRIMTKWLTAIAALLAFTTSQAQSFYTPENRANRWEFGFELLFQDSLDVDFRGGSTADLDSAVGFRFGFGYHYNDHLQVEFALDYADVDYDADPVPADDPDVGCWWDPWWGYICTPYQSTRSVDEFAYQLGVGVRWDISRTFTIRGAYEKQWVDVGTATSTPDFDVFRIGFGYRY